MTFPGSARPARKGFSMRRFTAVAAAVLAVLFSGGQAQAVHHHRAVYLHQYPVPAVAPVVPFLPSLLLQGWLLGHQQDQQGGGAGRPSRPSPPPPVPADVQATIKRVDDSLPDLVKEINAIAQLNPDRYKKYKPLEIPKPATTGGGGTGGTGGTFPPPFPGPGS